MAKKWECFLLGAAFGITASTITDHLLGMHVALDEKSKNVDSKSKHTLKNNNKDVKKFLFSKEVVDTSSLSTKEKPIFR